MSEKEEQTVRKNIRSLIRAYMGPRIAALHSQAKNVVTVLLNQLVRFIGGMTGETNIGVADYERNVLIDTVVHDDSHTHPSGSLHSFVDATPDTMPKRDGLGRIKGSGTTFGNTGLRLANGTDISSLFRNIAVYPFNPVNTKSGSGNYTNSIGISYNTATNALTLSRNLANFCPVNRHPDVKKDGCD